jgi:hypothetical protein
VRRPFAVVPFAGEAVAEEVRRYCDAFSSQRLDVPQPGIRAYAHAVDQQDAVISPAMLKETGLRSGDIGE